MLQDAASFAEAVRPLIEKLVKEQTRNVLRADRFDVVTPANGSKMGVRQPFGKREIFLPYTQEVANAQEGDAVLVLWRGSLSNGKVWAFGGGPVGSEGGGEVGGLPTGGNTGDILMKASNADYDAGWETPANAVEEDNTLPITSAAVYTEVGNINALLETI